MRALGNYMKIKVQLCIGGRSTLEDKRSLEGGTQIVVGTPGRINDLISNKTMCKFNLCLV